MGKIELKVKVTFEGPSVMLSFALKIYTQKGDLEVIYDVIVTSSDVARTKQLYLLNEIKLDMVKQSLKFSKSLTLHGLSQGQGQKSRSISHLKLRGTYFHMDLTRSLYDN